MNSPKYMHVLLLSNERYAWLTISCSWSCNQFFVLIFCLLLLKKAQNCDKQILNLICVIFFSQVDLSQFFFQIIDHCIQHLPVGRCLSFFFFFFQMSVYLRLLKIKRCSKKCLRFIPNDSKRNASFVGIIAI